ncbi:MAG: 16S rRNA (cytosine(1402)-N(4))-methyltransferase RsmH [Tepidiphilus sp.]|uniref:16S rRNA (cytosine(1402)-N(4))-methyltransferase RsmH n=1 Tax=Tepidiphilus succinatimandens TaxID=224436 RepID=UPI00112F5AEF|nr:16S rRNA (cytosine(1402)-N(4))-methyltransferase RsmH [Tepidiphilus succinatimandens]MBP6998042.1 16S rRNA (cytosine(1402)-N(4))-methyltransferase RsmH [Tepidiphilus sp.]MDK2797364.1 rRNA (cytosine1402-N4)-methyltransferase [Tepidiphilus sp.]
MSEAHVSVLLEEAIEALAPRPDGIYVDGTFGRGGHSRALLQRLGPQGRVIAFDRDPEAIAHGRAWSEPRLTLVHAPFSRLGAELDALGVAQVDGILLDLGVSSPQLDAPERGMSFRFDAPLDMRMDPTSGEPVSSWLARASREEIREVIKNYGEERFADAIAKAIVAARARAPIERTGRLAELVAQAVRTREPGQHPATRTFQALRIFVNRELEELSLTLPQAMARLRPGARLVVISFHSLEDRIVKHFMREHSFPPPLPPGLAVREAERPVPPLRWVVRKLRPSAEECARNRRARSAVMRVAERRS